MGPDIKQSNNRGYATATVISLMLVLTTMVAGFYLGIFLELNVVSTHIRNTKTKYLALTASDSYIKMIAKEYYKKGIYLEPAELQTLKISGLTGKDDNIIITRINKDQTIEIKASVDFSGNKKNLITELENADFLQNPYFSEPAQIDPDFYCCDLPIIRRDEK